MDRNETEYLQRQMALGKARLRKYVATSSGKTYAKRNIYIKTWKYVDDFLSGTEDTKRWVIIPGLRGTGKTTILAQTFYELMAKYSEQINLLYFSLNEAVDTLGTDLTSILAEYERLIGESYEVLSKPTVIMIDEVQSDPKWAPVLKALHERASQVFLICSGSSAVHLQDDADIPGRRAAVERLYPMNFTEFEMVHHDKYPERGLKDDLKNAFYYSKDAKECFKRLSDLKDRVDRYWAKIDRSSWRFYVYAGSLPFALKEKTLADVYDAVLSSVDKVISRDIQQLGRFKPETTPVIKRLLYILAESDVVSNNKLSEILGVTPVTVAEILDVLVKAELLVRIPPHGSQAAAAKKPSKYLFMSSVVRAAFFHMAGSSATVATREGRLYEDIAGLHYYRSFDALKYGNVSYDSSEGSADFIVKLPDSRVAIEIGRGSKSSRQVRETMKRIECKYGLVVCDDDLTLSNDEMVVHIPWDYFSLAG